MVAAIAVLALVGSSQVPLPPYKRLKTTVVIRDRDDAEYVVSGNILYVEDDRFCAAYDIRDLKRIWRVPLHHDVQNDHLAIKSGTLYVSAGDEKGTQAWLIALDARTGKLRWSLHGNGKAGALACSENTVLVGLNANSLSAVDIRNHDIRWQTKLPLSRERDLETGIDEIAISEGIVVVHHGDSTQGIRTSTGKQLWSVPGSYTFRMPISIASGVYWSPSGQGSMGVRVHDGKPLWKSKIEAGDISQVFGGKFIGLSNAKVNALNPKTGQVAWTASLGKGAGYIKAPAIGAIEGMLLVNSENRAAMFDGDGRKLWGGAIETAPSGVVCKRGSGLICFDGTRLIAYGPGERSQRPTSAVERQELAAKMVAKFDTLDPQDLHFLTNLGDDAFPPVLAAYLKYNAAFDADENGPHAMENLTFGGSLERILEAITTKKRWRDLLPAVQTINGKGRAKLRLLRFLAEFGDDATITPFFIKQLEKDKANDLYESNDSWAESYIANSPNPLAVSYMIQELKNPNGNPEVRKDAYINLARTGGERGIDAVLEARNTRKLLPPIAQRIETGHVEAGLFGSKNKILHERRGADGRTWGLLQCGVMGSIGDLWLVEKVNGKWTNPLFTGFSLSQWSGLSKAPPPEPKIGGKTARQLVDGAWFDVLVNNPEVRKDSTGCGMTDLVKKRLGLDPTKNDSDSDGDPDEMDPWPNAPQRPITEAEAVLAAVFEARYHFDESQVPAVFVAPWEMKPFEMPGRNGPTIWVPYVHGKDLSIPLQQCWQQGTTFIDFQSARDFMKPAPKVSKDTPDSIIKWNSDRTEATLLISTSYGGLNANGEVATVRKIRGTWVVVSLWISFVA